jgi:hypothetical protein
LNLRTRNASLKARNSDFRARNPTLGTRNAAIATGNLVLSQLVAAIAVREAYGMKANEDPLQFLLTLNFAVAEREAKGLPVVAPGLPPCVTDASQFITDDCVKIPE